MIATTPPTTSIEANHDRVMVPEAVVLRVAARILMQQNYWSAGRARVNFIHLDDFIYTCGRAIHERVKERASVGHVACKVARLKCTL